MSNRSGTDANNVTVVQNLPPSVIFGSASGTGWACGEAGGVVTCDLATLAGSSDAAPISVTVTTPPIEGPINTTATVSGDETDPVEWNDRAAEATTVLQPEADLRIRISDSPDPVALSGTLAYTLQVDTEAIDVCYTVADVGNRLVSVERDDPHTVM